MAPPQAMNDSSDGDELLYPQILLVEHELELAQDVLGSLTRWGLSVDYARSIRRALELIESEGSRYEAAVLDHELPDGDSLRLVSALNDHEPACSSLVLASLPDSELAHRYHRSGTFRMVSKPISGVQLIAHVHATMLDSRRWRTQSEAQPEPDEPPKVIIDIEAAADRLRFIAGLSSTEREVAYWLLQGARDSDLAQILGRSERTAKRHVSIVLQKAGVPNRSSLWAVLRNDGHPSPSNGEDPSDGGSTAGT